MAAHAEFAVLSIVPAARGRRRARFSMNNADLIIATLKANGVTRGFGIPSGNVLPLMEAMRTGGVEFVLTAHEGSAGFAADVTGRMTGAPGLCIATLGPGATNLATGVGGAFLDRSPVIAITCNLNTDQLGRRIQMWIDHHALFKPITKATFKLEPGCVAETVTRAIALALSEPKGPVHLDLPEDVALAATNEGRAPPAQPGKLAAAPDAALARAAELIAAATRPIAVVGATAMRVADPALLRNVIERHSLPFATTTMAKGMIDEDHPLSLGCIERACRQVQRKFLRSADLIVGIGYDTVEVEYEAWIGDRPLLQIDIEPVDVAPSVKLVHQVSGDFDARWRGSTRSQPRPINGTRRRSRNTGAAFTPRCVPQPSRSRRMPRSTRCAAHCRARDSSPSTSARTRIRSPANGARMRPRPSEEHTSGRPWASACQARSRPSSRAPRRRWSACWGTA